MDKANLFGTDDPKEIATKFSQYLSALNETNAVSDSGGLAVIPGEGGIVRLQKADSSVALLEKAMTDVELTKALGEGALTSIQAQIEAAKAAQADLVKDFSLTSPLSTGLVPFDLEAPAKLLTPKPTPLRNRLPRQKGVGTAHRYKRITGFTGTGTGGVGNLHPGITDSTTTTFGSINYIRGPKISYAADEATVPYHQFSLSDQVPWSAQFSGQGFQDIRQLSQTSVLWSSMLMEERMLLAGRGTASGYMGALSAPAGLSVAQRAAGAGETGLQGGRYWIKVTSEAQFGESVLSASIDLDTVTAGNVIDVTIGTLAAGALGYRVYAARVAAAGADPGDAAKFYQGRTGYNVYTLQGNPLITTGAAASGVTADTSAYANGYDGIMTIVMGTNTGYNAKLNSGFSTSNPGTEYQKAFASLYNAVKADPDEIAFNANDRVQLSDLLKTASSSNYRLTVRQDEIGGVVLGDVVTAIQNEVTGKVVQMSVHPWMVQGNSAILSYTLPIPDTQVSNVWSVFNVQDYMGIQWPITQFAYELSSYWYGTFLCYAPAWNGSVTNIKQV